MHVPTQGSHLVIPFGRLATNKLYTDPDDPTEAVHCSKWTGYEVYLDLQLNIWLVWNPKSLINPRLNNINYHGDWYPARCDLFEPYNPPIREPFDFEDTIDIAPFLSARVKLNGNFTKENLTFENFSRWVNATKQTENEVEFSWIDRTSGHEMVCRSPPFERDVPLETSLQHQAADPALGFSKSSGLPFGPFQYWWEGTLARMEPQHQRAYCVDDGYWTSHEEKGGEIET
ncbi:hypothetical protein O1611_g721 [Lasiodiplodia mahajangana]|uniref:Uncharacterized protein n=1 Tax=Lasiodiplodia mahajangana TaxID=1108764 RepID=A0ACC2JZN5_9PEZI|nr:hypothetical protein O1611_g721 [Lasiodiplodia mahajangana]